MQLFYLELRQIWTTMKRFRSTFYITLFFYLSQSAVSQPRSIRFEQLPSELGWSNHAVNNMLQDHQGFIWLATWAGLIKYDGYKAKIYRQEIGQANSLKSNKITCLFEDSQQRLWVGTRHTGFYLYDRSKDHFVQYQRNQNDMIVQIKKWLIVTWWEG